MAVSGTGSSPSGGAPTPDPQRVTTLRYSLVDEPDTFAAFAELARAALADLNDRTRAEIRAGDLAECAALLGHVRDRAGGLDPARLVPRSGLAGLFDSRSRRLKAFRAAYEPAVSAIGDTSTDLADRGAAMDRRASALDTLWSETRDAIAELDAHILAARAWLADRDKPDPEATPSEAPSPDETSVPEPHPLATRLVALEATRAVAVARLPLLRAAQNADCRTPVALKAVGDAITTWRADWTGALGLAGRKMKKVRPDPATLSQARAALTDRIAAAERDIAAAQARRAELDARVT